MKGGKGKKLNKILHMSEISSPLASLLLALLIRMLGSMHPHQSEPKQMVTSWFCISYDRSADQGIYTVAS
jgi:hypothetical protein